MLLGVGHAPCLECLAEFFAHKHNHVELDAGSEEIVEDDAMLLLRLVAQFAHIAENDALMRCIVHLERRQRSMHRRCVGVVGIHDELVAETKIDELAAHVLRLVTLDSLADLFDGHAEEATDSGSSETIDGIVTADEMRMHLNRLGGLGVVDAEREVRRAVIDRARQIGSALNSVSDGLVQQVAVERIDEDHAAIGSNALVEFRLGSNDAFERTKAQQMRLANIGDESEVGMNDGAKFSDVHRVIGTHLDDGKFMLGLHLKEGQRHTDLIVQIAFGGQHVELLTQHRADQFLGRCLSVCSRDANDLDGTLPVAELLAMIGSQLLKCGEHIGHEESSLLLATCIINHGKRSTFLEHFIHIGIAIETLSLQRKEDLPGLDLAAVGGDVGMGEIGLV